jgi:hypothetical protein
MIFNSSLVATWVELIPLRKSLRGIFLDFEIVE